MTRRRHRRILGLASLSLLLAALAQLALGDEVAPTPGPAPVGKITLYRAVREGGQADPADSFRLYQVLEITWPAPAGSQQPTAPPVPVPPPGPSPATIAPPPAAPATELQLAASVFGRAVPYGPALAAGVRGVADQVTRGELAHLNEIVAAVARLRRGLGPAPDPALGVRLGVALDREARAGCDADGTVRDPAAVARALLTAAEALEAPRGP
jgi:hypothetical protein